MTTTDYIRVVAPATLDENFTFDVLLDGQPFTVVVPQGGVTMGEEFEVPYTRHNERGQSQVGCEYSLDEDDRSKDGNDIPLPPTIGSSSSDEDDQSTDEHDRLGAPYGRFRVSLCSCCDVLTQSTFWMALFCFPVLMAQLLTRLRLKWDGHASPPSTEREEQTTTFIRVVMTFVTVLILGYIPILGTLVFVIFYLATSVWIGGNLRRHVRQRYQIPRCCSLLPNNAEDRCAMCFCWCCAAIQMARHTHDDKEYPGYCCSTTGLEIGAPKLLPTYRTNIKANKK